MTPNDIITMITTVGFPIVMCGALGYYVKYTNDRNREDLLTERTSHKEEIETMTAAINNNTLALQKLTDYIERK